MMFTSTSLAVFGLASLGTSHMIMNTPVPFGKSTLNNSALDSKGADFPCKQRPGVYSAEGASNIMPLGSSQPLKFTGSATHGGGSCQISITYDKAPTASSTWKVIHSIEGGCPIQGVAGNNGNDANAVDPSTYSFPIPSNLPTGEAVLAWSWFNKIGNREMYMNCAPITLTGGASKRSAEDEELMARNITQLMERDTAAYNALPDMFIANIPATSCTTEDSQDLAFPNPGDSVERLGMATSTPKPPKGPSCGAAGAAPVPTGGATPTTSAASSSSATNAPGVFITKSTSAPAATEPAATAPPAAPSQPAASPVVSSTAPVATGVSGYGTAFAAGLACSDEGMWNCVGGNSFQRCASGTWSVVGPLAAGTKCTPGSSAGMEIAAIEKRSIRFSGEHIRRHLQKYRLV